MWPTVELCFQMMLLLYFKQAIFFLGVLLLLPTSALVVIPTLSLIIFSLLCITITCTLQELEVAEASSFAAFQDKVSWIHLSKYTLTTCMVPNPDPHTRAPVLLLGGEGVNTFVLHKRDWRQPGLSWRESLYQERLWGKETLKRLWQSWSWWGAVLLGPGSRCVLWKPLWIPSRDRFQGLVVTIKAGFLKVVAGRGRAAPGKDFPGMSNFWCCSEQEQAENQHVLHTTLFPKQRGLVFLVIW